MASAAAAHLGKPAEFEFPPYMANLVVCEDIAALGSPASDAFDRIFRVLRPYGGTAALRLSIPEHETLVAWCRSHSGSRCQRDGEFSVLVREGALPGSSDYTGTPNCDELVASPLGVLWFGDTFQHHKLYWKGYLVPETGRGLPKDISVVGGVMKYTAAAAAIGVNPPNMPYRDYLKWMDEHVQYEDAYTDIYTGRVLSQAEGSAALRAASVRNSAPDAAPTIRRNPLTGILEAREFSKSHGCDLSAVDYGNILTLRSGTAAYYDSRGESGLVNISGTRSGCRNTIIPGDGVLCLPSWTGNCTCNYPIFTSLAMVQMGEEHEEWAAWGSVAAEAPIRAWASTSAHRAIGWCATEPFGWAIPGPVGLRRASRCTSSRPVRSRSIVIRCG